VTAVDDRTLMEASLAAIGDRYEGLAAELFEALIAAHPEHAHAFLNPAAARERMTRETLQALLGLAADEGWVATTVVDFVDLHHKYAAFSANDYADWFALAIAGMERRAGADWPRGATAAWRRQTERLTRLVAGELARGTSPELAR
jgi:hypothetical protein